MANTIVQNKEQGTFLGHPKGLYVLFFTEMWERFGYYLMVGIFLLYMIDPISSGGLGFSLKKALDIVGTYVALVYLAPFLGGLIADRLIGYRKAILLGGVMMAAGYFGLAIHSETAMYFSCLCIILGNGFFKPNISTLLGNMYNEEALKTKKDSAYNIFYMGINIGAFLCNFVAAYMRNNYGWGYAFGAAGVGLLIGIITDGDLRRHMERELLAHRASDVMTKTPKTVDPGMLAAEALAYMNTASSRVTCLFVVDPETAPGRPVGILHVHDCLRAGLR
jgi:POT family proton-dependent oligopeptide transporter